MSEMRVATIYVVCPDEGVEGLSEPVFSSFDGREAVAWVKLKTQLDSLQRNETCSEDAYRICRVSIGVPWNLVITNTPEGFEYSWYERPEAVREKGAA